MKKIWVYSILSIFLLSSCGFPVKLPVETSPIVILYVGPEKVNCDNPLRNNICYQVKNTPEGEWESYKGEIMGLEYQPDFFYELQVRKDTLSELSQNAPEPQWVLLKIIQKVKSSGGGFDLKNELTGSVWMLYQFGSPLALHSAAGTLIPTIHFQADGHFTGSTGCNRFNGSYTVNNPEIHFASVAATKKMCADQSGMLEQEQTILKIIETAQTLKFENNQLMIYSASDSQVLIYKK